MVRHKAALERRWKDQCSIFIQRKKTDPITKVTDFVETLLIQDQPCKLSFETLTSTNGENVATAEQSAKLFISSELVIPAGSKIVVSHGGRTFEFSQSGEPGIFTYHQEIQLQKFRKWA